MGPGTGETAPRAAVLDLLGGFRLVADGVEMRLPRKAAALLAVLAVAAERGVAREWAAELLWPDRGPEQARQSLRQALLALRQALPAGVVRSAGAVLSISMAGSTAGSMAGSMAGEAAGIGCDLWEGRGSGALLAGFPPVSDGFDAWLRDERERLAGAALAALAAAAAGFEAAGDAAGAIGAVERMVALDPLREDQQRRLMAAYAAAGRRGDALRQFQACESVLRRELDIAPAGETVALAAAIREGPGATEPLVRSEGPPWIGVLPFRSIGGGDAVPGYFAAGLTDDLVCALATLREPVVVAAGAIAVAPDRRAAARELGVRYLVSGSVRRAGTRLRIVVELMEAEHAAMLWSHAYELDDTALFDVQDDLVVRIVGMLMPYIDDAELRRSRAKRPGTMTSYDLLLQARARMARLDAGGFDEAGALLSEARALDPGYAQGHALHADWLNLRIGQGWSGDPMGDAHEADRSARLATDADRFSSRALAIQGHNRSFLYRDYDGGLELLGRALDAGPNDATALMWSASTFAYIGQGADSISRADRALRLSPRDPFVFRFYASLCLAHYTAGSFEAAAAWGMRGVRASPDYTSNLRFTAASLVAMGRIDEARAVARAVLRVAPGFRVGALAERHPYRDPARRRMIAERLVEAGLPA